MNVEVTAVFGLSPAEKIQLIEDLWENLAATPEAVPIHDWQKDELVRRKANLLKHPGSGRTWEEVQRSVRGRCSQSSIGQSDVPSETIPASLILSDADDGRAELE